MVLCYQTDLVKEIVGRSIELGEKIEQLLAKFNEVITNGSNQFEILAKDILVFFSNHSSNTDDYLLGGLNKFLKIVDQNLSKFSSDLLLDEFKVIVEINQSTPLFQKSLQFFLLCYKMQIFDAGSQKEIELVENILRFYLPEDMDLFCDEKTFEPELIEICQMMMPSIEKLLTDEIKEEFDSYLLGASFLPDTEIDNGEMKDLNPQHGKTDLLNFSHVENIPNETRLIFSKALLILSQHSFHQNNHTNALILAKNSLMFGQDLLNKKLTANAWLIIGKCLSKYVINNQRSNNLRSNTTFFAFYMSLLYQKENPETHVWLAIISHRFYLLFKESTKTSSIADQLKKDYFKSALKHEKRFRQHIICATSYIQSETKIESVTLILYTILTAIQNKHVETKTFTIEKFIATCLTHLHSLANQEIERPTLHSVEFIESNCQKLLDSNEMLHSIPQSWRKPLDSISESLKKVWMEAREKSLQNDSSQSELNVSQFLSQSLVSNSQLSYQSTDNEYQPSSQPIEEIAIKSQYRPDEIVENESQVNSSTQNNPNSKSQLGESQKNEDEMFLTQIEEEEKKRGELMRQWEESLKKQYEIKLKFVKKKFNKEEDQLNDKITELQSQLDISKNKCIEIAKQHEDSLERNDQLSKELADLRQLFKDEEKDDEEIRQLKRRYQNEKNQIQERKRVRRNDVLKRSNLNDSENESI